MSTEASLTNEAVAMMKRGATPEAVWARLVELGADAAWTRALVDRLVELKRQAEASDPKRLVQEVTTMIAQGASFEAALQHLTSQGIAEAHAAPEVQRIYAAHQQRLASMRPCGRCGSPTLPSETYFDRLGNQVCDHCHAEDEIGASEQRVEDARLEAAGVPLHQIQENNKVVWCPRCQDHSAVLWQATHVISQGISTATRAYQCTRCGQFV